MYMNGGLELTRKKKLGEVLCVTLVTACVCMGGSCVVNSSVYLQMHLTGAETDTEGTALVISLQLSLSSLRFLSPLLPVSYRFQS